MAGLEGKTLDHYELQRLIGKGGMADVYEGIDRYFRRKVAVKVFRREDEEMLRRFIREANLMASLSNEHLVPIYGSGEVQVDGFPQYYIVMPFMEGGTLRARIRRAPLSLAEACRDLRDIASALDYIHSQGIIHRDIKSSNVLLDAEGRCYLSDFGIARMTTDVTQLTSTGNVLGTVDYVAPELFEPNRKADALSDLYSLGVLLFEIVTGQLPFYAENQIAVVTMHVNKPPPSPRSLNPSIPPQVERVILRSLEKRPESRYASGSELAEAFCLAVAASARNGWQEQRPGPLAPIPAVAAVNPAAPIFVRPAPVLNQPEAPPFAQVSKVTSRPVERRQQRPRRTSPARQRLTVAIVLALLALLVIAIFATLAITHGPGGLPASVPTQPGTTPGSTQAPSVTPTVTPDLTATAQAQATATVQAQQNATATAVAGATATVQAQASATAGVVQTATAGKPVYQDALNNANNPATAAANWDQNDHCTFQSDGYHVTETVNLVALHGCREANNTYDNATISVDVRINSGHSGGLFFRVSVDVLGNYNGGYLFEIDSQGNYKISLFNTSPQPLQNWAASSALKQGNNVTNTLQVIARGGVLLFYANGVFLKEIDDTTYASGVIAFLATTTDTNADIVYSNLKVYPIS